MIDADLMPAGVVSNRRFGGRVLAVTLAAAPLMMGARRTGASGGCGFSAARGRMVRVAKSPEQRLHDRLTDTQALGGAPLDALTLRLDTSSRFYVFDQNLTERTSVFGARIGRACLPDPSVVGAAATAWCHPVRSDGAMPPGYCDQRPASAPRIPLQALGQYCFHNGGGQSVMALCPEDRCSTRCDLHIPGECIHINTGGIVGSSYGVRGAYHRERPVEWAQLPYTLGDDGGDERVALTTLAGVPWGHPVRAVRNYDLGACGAFVTYEALARLVEEQFHPQIAGELFRDSGVDWIDSLQTRVDAGPRLRGVSFTTEDEIGMHFSVRADVEPFGTAGINGLPWGDVYGQLRVGTVPVYTSEGGHGARHRGRSAPQRRRTLRGDQRVLRRG